ncbi:MAG: sodium:solute symporter [Bacteroidales bacterium]|jgi:Na+/proline symporter
MVLSPFMVILIVVSYFAVLLLIGHLTGRRSSNAGFFLGNRNSPWYVVAFGMISASLSGVTFISVPGWVVDSQFSYMQMILGYLVGYAIIAGILMPMYYKLNLTSIYTYLRIRFGHRSYKTGASFFLLSRVIGASFRLFLVANVLQITIFQHYHVPFAVTVIVTILLIWLYTFRGGIKTIIWTDSLQTFFMLLAVGITTWLISKELGLGWKDAIHVIEESKLSKIFFFEDWRAPNHFIKQFLGGVFIAVVMTGLDQDMMQKNLSCRNIKEAKKNMYWFSFTLIPVNLLFLSLGVLLVLFAQAKGIAIPERTDDLFPLLATQGYLSPVVAVVFMIGLVAAAYSSADSALTALTTSFTVDILEANKLEENALRRLRMKVHVGVSVVLAIVILIFHSINNSAVISAIFTIAGYTYGPLLGFYSFGLFTRRKVIDAATPYIAVMSPILTLGVDIWSKSLFNGYEFGFELLLVNGVLTFIGLLFFSRRP